MLISIINIHHYLVDTTIYYMLDFCYYYNACLGAVPILGALSVRMDSEAPVSATLIITEKSNKVSSTKHTSCESGRSLTTHVFIIPLEQTEGSAVAKLGVSFALTLVHHFFLRYREMVEQDSSVRARGLYRDPPEPHHWNLRHVGV